MNQTYFRKHEAITANNVLLAKGLALRHFKAFTLVELMFVLAIMSILVSMAVPSYQTFIKRSHRTEGQALLLDLQTQLDRYYFQYQEYPDGLSKLKRYQSNEVDSENSYYKASLSPDASCKASACYLLVAKHQSGEERETLSLYSSGEKQGPWR